MNAGLLGEHLASPRTAPKTNQSTALDPKTAKGGDSATKDGFASFVSKDSQPASAGAPPPENAIGVANTPTPIASPAHTVSLDEAMIGAVEREADVEQAKAAPPLLDAAEMDARTTPTLTAQSLDDGVQVTPAKLTNQAPAGEVLAQDPRVRAQTESRDAARAARGETIKLSDPAAAIAGDTNIAIDADIDLVQRDRTPTGFAEVEADVPRTLAQFNTAEVAAAEAQSRQTMATDVLSSERLLSAGVSRDIPNLTADPVLTTAPVVTTSGNASTVSVNGLTPTAPSIPLATPNELTGIIVNAINNGLDPQEQLVVQMDPPELGRVLIDFKFDAQGLQQVLVTTENPEALKRLRELHFELTQALKEHGLSEQNMSFRQESEGHSQEAWSSDNSGRRDAQYFAAEERRASPSAPPNGPRTSVQERLDLLL